MTEFAQIIELLMEFFRNDEVEVILWLAAENHYLGEISPFTMIGFGRSDKLLKFIQTQKYVHTRDGDVRWTCAKKDDEGSTCFL